MMTYENPRALHNGFNNLISLNLPSIRYDLFELSGLNQKQDNTTTITFDCAWEFDKNHVSYTNVLMLVNDVCGNYDLTYAISSFGNIEIWLKIGHSMPSGVEFRTDTFKFEIHREVKFSKADVKKVNKLFRVYNGHIKDTLNFDELNKILKNYFKPLKETIADIIEAANGTKTYFKENV